MRARDRAQAGARSLRRSLGAQIRRKAGSAMGEGDRITSFIPFSLPLFLSFFLSSFLLYLPLFFQPFGRSVDLLGNRTGAGGRYRK